MGIQLLEPSQANVNMESDLLRVICQLTVKRDLQYFVDKKPPKPPIHPRYNDPSQLVNKNCTHSPTMK